MPNYNQDLYIKFQLDTTLRMTDSLHNTNLIFYIPTDYGFLYSTTSRRDVFATFLGKPTFTTNTITWTMGEDMIRNKDYFFYITQAVRAPSTNDQTSDAFSGKTMYKGVTVDDQISGGSSFSDSMYAQLKDSVSEDSTNV